MIIASRNAIPYIKRRRSKDPMQWEIRLSSPYLLFS